MTRTEALCNTRLNGKNLISAINEHAISLINYYTGLLKLEPNDFSQIDFKIRQILNKHGYYLQPACLERLYLPRSELGRRLKSIEFKSEQMLWQLFNSLNNSSSTSTRRAAILKVEKYSKSHFYNIVEFLKIKYNLQSVIDLKSLETAQKSILYSEIAKKTKHEKLFRIRSNELISIKKSSTWLKHGNIQPKDEAWYCHLQDRNMFGGENAKCPHCKERQKTVDHLATQCEKMLYHDYTRRHNEVVRCIHLGLCKKYNLKSSPKIRSHSVQEILANENAEIRVDTRVNTGIKIDANRPDIFIHDKKRKEVILIEIGITSQDRLMTVETEKKRKYDVLANKLGMEMNCKTKIIPYVMTWDGVVTNYHKNYSKEIGLTDSIESYIQTIVLKKTLESISFDYRRESLSSNEVQEKPILLAEEQEATTVNTVTQKVQS